MNIDLTILSIQDVSFYINAVLEPKEIKLRVDGGKLGIDAETKTVSFSTGVTLLGRRNIDVIETFMKYENYMSFRIENFEEVFKLDNGQYRYDISVSHFLLNIVLSTLRGILYTKTAGTKLKNWYLPLITAEQVTTRLE